MPASDPSAHKMEFQCSIPAFEALFPEPHNEVVLKLLFICAQWHALAKLRLHHDLTLKLLEHTTTLLGAQIRLFYRDTCRKVQTKELRREAEARARREVKTADGTASSSRKPATLNIFTIKFHFLGDYPSVIRRFGTTDSYSTETVSRAWLPSVYDELSRCLPRVNSTTERPSRGIPEPTRKTTTSNFPRLRDARPDSYRSCRRLTGDSSASRMSRSLDDPNLVWTNDMTLG